jgi:transcriptional regulator with XRE-family HTH domain
VTAAEALGARIRNLREKRGLTQDELARRCGRSGKSTVGRWELGQASPPAELLPTVAEVLGTTVGELFGEAA